MVTVFIFDNIKCLQRPSREKEAITILRNKIIKDEAKNVQTFVNRVPSTSNVKSRLGRRYLLSHSRVSLVRMKSCLCCRKEAERIQTDIATSHYTTFT
jgi:hypothetical protein